MSNTIQRIYDMKGKKWFELQVVEAEHEQRQPDGRITTEITRGYFIPLGVKGTPDDWIPEGFPVPTS